MKAIYFIWLLLLLIGCVRNNQQESSVRYCQLLNVKICCQKQRFDSSGKVILSHCFADSGLLGEPFPKDSEIYNATNYWIEYKQK